MPKAIHSARHKKLTELLIAQRRQAGMTQAQVAKALGRHQPFIANIENGERRLDIVELLDLAAVIGLDVHGLIDELEHTPQHPETPSLEGTVKQHRRGKPVPR